MFPWFVTKTLARAPGLGDRAVVENLYLHLSPAWWAEPESLLGSSRRSTDKDLHLYLTCLIFLASLLPHSSFSASCHAFLPSTFLSDHIPFIWFKKSKNVGSLGINQKERGKIFIKNVSQTSSDEAK